MALTAEEQANLTNLRAQYYKILGGQNVTSMQEGNSRTQFGVGDPNTLKQEIERLEAKASRSGSDRGALTFRIGSHGRGNFY